MTNILIILASILNFVLGFITLSKNSKSLSNISFAVLSFSLAIWALLFIPYENPLLFDSFFWIRIIYLLVVLVIGSMVFFSYSFPYGDKPNLKILLLYFALNIPIVYALFFTHSFIQEVKQTTDGPATIVGPFYWYSTVVWGVFALGIVISKLIKKYKQAISTAKFQLLYMFLGLGIFGIAAAILDGIIPILFETSKFFSLSASFSLFFVGTTAYAIVRHRLMDIKVALQEVVVFLTTSLIISSLFMLSALTYWTVANQQIKLIVFPIILLVSSILVLLYERLTALSKIFARYLHLSVYDYQKVLRDLSLRLSSNLDLQKLIDVLTEELIEIFRLKKVAILLYDHGKSKYILQKVIGFKQTPPQIEEIFNSFTSIYFPEAQKIIDLEEIRKLANVPVFGFKENTLKQLARVMEQNELSLIIPLIIQNRIIGIVVIGDKASLDPYTIQDINFLNTLAYETAIVFQNAKSYEEIQRFNITLREEVEKATSELKRANERLKELDQLKDDFVSVTSHELRTPMTAIRSYAWMALHRSSVKLPDNVEKYLIRVLLSTERLINLVNDMLNISRIEGGRIEINPEAVDLIKLTHDVVDEAYYSKGVKKNIHFSILEERLPKVLADPEKLREVMLNILGNAVKFTTEGGSITISFFTDGKVVETSVKDTGPGIAKEDLSRLFKKFGRLDNAYTALATSGGTGLGLYISKNLIELMHGGIWAASEGTGKGSTFTFALPVATPRVLEDVEKFRVRPKGEVKGLEPVAI